MNLARNHPAFLCQTDAAKLMLDGQAYFANDKYLVQVRGQTKVLCGEYNQCLANDSKKRGDILKRLLPFAKKIRVEANFYCDYGVNIQASAGVYLNHNVTILDGALVQFGENVLVGPNTVIASTSHAKDHIKRRAGECVSRPIIIENDVWIGANVTVLGGVTIGEGAIVGAGVVVRNDLAPFTVLK